MATLVQIKEAIIEWQFARFDRSKPRRPFMEIYEEATERRPHPHRDEQAPLTSERGGLQGPLIVSTGPSCRRSRGLVHLAGVDTSTGT